MDTIVYPDYYRILECRAGRWFVKNADVFYRSNNSNVNYDDFVALYGVTEQQVVVELFRINGGKTGYYLVNLRDKKYYYCGTQRDDLKRKLLELGIGREEPQ
ncbi:hypothetical protein NUACC21_68240 [Scytonema sp. NUACC21]